MTFVTKKPEEHPLNWSDKELLYMLSVAEKHKSINNTVMYHLMGYEGERPNTSFIKRLDQLRLDGEGRQG